MQILPMTVASMVLLGSWHATSAVEPSNMQQASPVPLAADGEALKSTVERLDPSLDTIVSSAAKVTVVKGDNYFGVLEGGTWVPDGKVGYLLFTDFPANVVYKWAPDSKQMTVFLTKSGYTGALTEFSGHPITTQYGAPIYVYDFGANGIEQDPQGRIVLCAHGDRQIVRLERSGERTVLATGFEGERFYHPNEMTIRSDGSIYITDARPAAGVSPDRKEKYGVFMIKDGTVRRVIAGQSHGVAFSPDEKRFYATTYGSQAIMQYDVKEDGTFENGRVFVDMSGQKGAPNGMAVDSAGNVYAGGPGGLWIMNSGGKHLGTLPLPAIPANAVFGGADLRTLFIMDARNLLQIRLKIPGTVMPSRLKGSGSHQ